MKRKSTVKFLRSFGSSTAVHGGTKTAAWKIIGLFPLLTCCSAASGCATTSQAGTDDPSSGTSAALAGPAYYQSNDNPFHAD
jgi:hypothetical protein